MNTTEQNQTTSDPDNSDDLIAELARLVAKDARSTSANKTAYERTEPSFVLPKPAFEMPAPKHVQQAESDWDSEAEFSNPNLDYSESPIGVEPIADSGFPESHSAFDLQQSWASPQDANDFSLDQLDTLSPQTYENNQSDTVGYEPATDFSVSEHYASPEDTQFNSEPEFQSEQSIEDFDPIAGLIGLADEDISAPADENHDSNFTSEIDPTENPLFRAFRSARENQESIQPAPDEDAWPDLGERTSTPDDLTVENNAPLEQLSSSTLTADALSDIEAFIGQAARNSAQTQLPNAGRRVRSIYQNDDIVELTSSSDEVELDDEVDVFEAAETAMLATAAASAAATLANAKEQASAVRSSFDDDLSIGEVDFDRGFVVDPKPQRPGKKKRVSPSHDEAPEGEYFSYGAGVKRPSFMKRVAVPVVAGLAICAVAAGAYVLFSGNDTFTGEAPVLTASDTQFKQDAEPNTNASTASQSVIFNEIEGNGSANQQETLVSRDQTQGATGSEVTSIIGTPTESGLVNRPVRTVTVRPDGTIVTTDGSLAANTTLPVDRPNVPQLPNSTLTDDPIGDAITSAIAGGQVATAVPTPQQPADPTVMPTLPEATPLPTQPQPLENVNPTLVAPVPIARPSGLVLQRPTAAAPATQTPIQTAATPTATTAGAWVQLASQRTEADARSEMSRLGQRYGALFNGATTEINRVDLGERGIYYRVRLPQPNMASGNSVCNAIKAQGGDCFVMNN